MLFEHDVYVLVGAAAGVTATVMYYKRIPQKVFYKFVDILLGRRKK